MHRFLTLIIPGTMLATGLVFLKWAPKSINWLAGYRSRRSTINDDTWTFANRTMGRVWTIWGLCLLVPALILLFVFKHLPGPEFEKISLILSLIQLLFMLLSIIPVEKALKARFDDQGRRRDDA